MKRRKRVSGSWLSDEAKKLIIDDFLANGETEIILAKRHGVSQTTIHQIISDYFKNIRNV